MPRLTRGGEVTASNTSLGDILILEEQGTNSRFWNKRGMVVSMTANTCDWKLLEPVELEPVGEVFMLRWSRFIRVGSATAGSHNTIIGWFPKKPWLNEDISDVDWNPYE
jgi:hypothetical protein